MLPRRGLVRLVLHSPSALAQQSQGQPLPRHDLEALYSLRASLGLRARVWPDPCDAWTGVACSVGRISGIRSSRASPAAVARGTYGGGDTGSWGWYHGRQRGVGAGNGEEPEPAAKSALKVWNRTVFLCLNL